MVSSLDGYDLAGTGAVVGGILFASGVGVRSHLKSDDTVHWLSWIGLIMIAVGMLVSAACWHAEKGMEGLKKPPAWIMMATMFGFAAFVLWMFVETVQDHAAYKMPLDPFGNQEKCAHDTTTVLKGPAIMEIGSAGNPGLDVVAAWTFAAATISALWHGGHTIKKDAHPNAFWGFWGFYVITLLLLGAMAGLVTNIGLKIDNKDVFHASVQTDAGLQEDIYHARMNVYGVIVGAMLSVGVTSAFARAGNDESQSEGLEKFIRALHMFITALCFVFVIFGAVALFVTTHTFWTDGDGEKNAYEFAPQFMCWSESQHEIIAIGNTFFAFFLPFVLSMCWRAFRPADQSTGDEALALT
jgi:hypothetical protein